MRRAGWLLVGLGAVAWLIAMGQRPPVAGPAAHIAEAVPRDATAIDDYLAEREASWGDVVPGAQERVRWAAAPGTRSGRVILVFHGFSASPRELVPLPDQLADDLGANVVYVRSRGHGRPAAALARASARQWLEDAERGLAVAKAVGDQVTVLGNSTGAAQALWLVHRHSDDAAVDRAVLISPNLGPQNKLAELVRYPWLGSVLTTVMPTREFETRSDDHARYWTSKHSTVAVLAMMDLVQRARALDPRDIDRPVLVILNPDDHAIDAALAESWLSELPDVRIEHHTPPASENQHVLAGDIVNPGGTEALYGIIDGFLR